MSGTTNNSRPAPTPGYRQPRQGYRAYSPNNNDWDSFRIAVNERGGFREPGVPAEDRTLAGPLRLASFPVAALSPMGFVVFDEMARDINPRWARQSIPETPPTPRFMGQRWNLQPTTTQLEQDSRLTQDEQNKALKKLKKQIYYPTHSPKSMAKRVNLYYRSDNATNNFNEKFKAQDEDAKRCAICLDDFEPNQPVMLTPCNHMFHEECIVPWVKSHGQCPVCRFAICERMREHALPLNNTARRPTESDLLSATELMSIIRAMDGAFEWTTRH